MDQIDDHIAVLTRALDQTGAVIAAIRPTQAGDPTPCRSWDVRALVNHVVDEVAQFASVTGGGERLHLDGDVIGEDWVDAYIEAAESLLKSWQRPGALTATVKLPVGDFPAAWTLGQQVTELVIHAWDIAKATDQPTDLDPELGMFAMRWARENLKPEYRADESEGGHVAAEIPISTNAPLYDRLAAFGGRDPNWTP